jgi:FkbM family methyltransferase
VLANAVRAATHPRLAASWVSWKVRRAVARPPEVTLPHGGLIGKFPSFTDYWCFKPLTEEEFQFIRRAVPKEGVCFDVGANIGMFTVAIAREHPSAVIHAFEPLPAAFEALAYNTRVNGVSNVVLHQKAVSSTSGTLLFNGAASGTQANHVVADGDVGTRVQACALDDVARERGVDFIDLVKLDVEGYECAVVEGARHLLASGRIAAIFLEVIPVLLERQHTSVEALLSRLADFGYVVCDLRPTGETGEPMTAPELRRRQVGNYIAVCQKGAH